MYSKYCLNAIDVAINDRSLENGGIETWIIPKKNLTKKQKKQDLFNSTKWGKGPDLEVVANFLYSLALFDHRKYSSIIEKGINYIVAEQKEKGFWESRWYYGNYYGTYVSLRLLNLFPNLYITEKQKVKNFLIDSQNDDGSFDINHSKNLSTSFAIFCIDFLNDDSLLEMKKKAQLFLSKQQQADGSWSAENFIRPKAFEPYKSSTLTTAYVIKALL